MTDFSRHIIRLLVYSAAMLSCSGFFYSAAQELRMLPDWEKEFRDVRPLIKQDTLTIRFLGDIMMHSRQIEEAADADGCFDFSSYFRYIRKDIESADLAVANMEFTLGGPPYSGYPAFSAPDKIAEYAAECGIDIFLLANNHIYDKGRAGAERTLETYRRIGNRYGTRYTGLASDQEEWDSNQPLRMTVKGIRLGFLNLTYGTNGIRLNGWPKVGYLDDDENVEASMFVSDESDIEAFIVLPHWGEEYQLRHSIQQEKIARMLIDNGADLIIGTHPHVVQDTTSFTSGGILPKKVHVAYSLGNAVSNMSARNTQLELMITVRIMRTKYGHVEISAPELTFLWCSRPGGYDNGYTVIPIDRFIGKRDMWDNGLDYDNMMATYARVKKLTGIE